MKNFKKIDLSISIFLLAGFTLASIIAREMDYVLLGYFVIGGWQLISMATHRINNWFMEKGGKRSIYHWIVIIILAIALLGTVINQVLFGLLVVMVFLSPFLAIYYTRLCYHEYYTKMQRPIELLK